MTFDREKYKQFARQQIAGRRKTAAIAVIILILISFLFSIPETNANYSLDDINGFTGGSWLHMINYLVTRNQLTPLKAGFSIIETLITFILTIATSHFFLAYSRSPEPVPLKVFFEGFNKWGRGILTGLWQSLWLLIWIFAYSCLAVLVTMPFALIFSEDSEITAFVSLIAVIAASVFVVIKTIEYSQHFYLVAEFPELGIRKALRISILITKGHRRDIFITHLTFLGYYLLSAITLGLALIWFKPYIEMTFINIYHALLKDALENGKLKPEDFN